MFHSNLACRCQWPSGYRARLRCEKTQVRITPRTVVSIATDVSIYSLGHVLRTFTVVPVDSVFRRPWNVK